MRSIRVTLGPFAAANAALLAASQTPVSGTPLTLTGTQPDTARRVLLTFGNEAAARTLALTGTDRAGQTISETLVVPSGASGVALSALDYATVTNAVPGGSGWSAPATLGTYAGGTAGPAGSSAWARLDDYGFAPVDLQVDLSGTMTFTVEASDDDPNAGAPLPVIAPSAMSWTCPDTTNLSQKSASLRDSLATPPSFVRVSCNAYTGSAQAVLVVKQPGGKYG